MYTSYFAALGLMVVLVSFLGFCVENMWLAMTKGYMDNRNMRLPFLLGYGLAMVAVFLIFGTPQQPHFFSFPIPIESTAVGIPVYFIIVSACVACGEILLGTFVEKVCGIVWWNYSALPMHITKYTSIPTTCAFGMMITLFMGYFFVPLFQRFMEIPSYCLLVCSIGLLLLLVVDFFNSAWIMYKTRSLSQYWCIDLSHTRLHKFWLIHNRV